MKKYLKSFHREFVGNAKRAKDADLTFPKYFCETCTKCKENRCEIFKRYVIKDYNRCFHHSNYRPIVAMFGVSDEFERLIRRA